MKKAIAILLTLLMILGVFSAVPLTASAEETEIAETGATSGRTGDCTWTLDGTELTISGNGAMGDYETEYSSGSNYSTAPWGESNITKVTISNGVTTIGNSAFSYCRSLTSVSIPDSVTTIGYFAFEDCNSLTSVTIPDSVTTIGNGAFFECYNLKSVSIPDSVTSIGDYAFSGTAWYNNQPDGLVYAGKFAYRMKGDCPAEVAIKDGTLGIAGHAFYKCSSLKSVSIPDSVTSIGYEAFSGCSSLTSVSIPDSVTSIGDYAFSGTAWYNNQPDGLVYAGKFAYRMKGDCPAEVAIKDGTLGIAGYAFSDCSSLTSVTIPDSVTSIGGGAFSDCSSLTSVTIGKSVTSIGSYAFYKCSSLTSVTIPDSVTSIGYKAFSGCSSLTSVTIPDSVTSIGDYAFSDTAWYNNQPDGLVYAGKFAYKMKGKCPAKVAIKDGTLGIAGAAFSDCYGLNSVTIPDSVTSIGGGAFSGCTLNSVSIPDSVTSIGDYAFYDCYNLNSVSIGNSVTSIGVRAFYGCIIPKSVTIPDSVTSIGEEAFGYYYDDFGNDYDAKVSGFTICGYRGSVAEAYAKKNGFDFKIVIGKCEQCHTELFKQDYKKGYPATCTEDGLTDGYTCPSCGYQVKQTVIPALGHKPVIDHAVEATCQHAGHTLGSYCERCGEVYIQSTIIPPLPHTVVIDPAVPADCTHTGLTEGSHCSVCHEVITAQQVIPSGHNYVYLAATPATAEHKGLTEGVYCSRCGDWLIEQELIPRIGYELQSGDADCDEQLTVIDATYIQYNLTRFKEKGVINKSAADVDKDGEVGIADATFIRRYAAGIKTPCQIGKPVN